MRVHGLGFWRFVPFRVEAPRSCAENLSVEVQGSGFKVQEVIRALRLLISGFKVQGRRKQPYNGNMSGKCRRGVHAGLLCLNLAKQQQQAVVISVRMLCLLCPKFLKTSGLFESTRPYRCR